MLARIRDTKSIVKWIVKWIVEWIVMIVVWLFYKPWPFGRCQRKLPFWALTRNGRGH